LRPPGAPLAEIVFRHRYKFGQDKQYMLACEGMYTGQFIYCGAKAQIAVGNVLPLSKIPEGTVVSNIEQRPGDRGLLGRGSGTYCIIVTHNEDTGRTQIRLPSGMKKTVPNNARAMVGLVGGGGRLDKPLLKAGRAFHKYRVKRNRWPIVRGVAMNPADHPHGGGNHQHIGHASTCRRDAPPGAKVSEECRVPPWFLLLLFPAVALRLVGGRAFQVLDGAYLHACRTQPHMAQHGKAGRVAWTAVALARVFSDPQHFPLLSCAWWWRCGCGGLLLRLASSLPAALAASAVVPPSSRSPTSNRRSVCGVWSICWASVAWRPSEGCAS
jgi:large subunit ribosomal protein L8e